METIVIDANTFIQGASLNEFTQNGGYSPASRGINHLYAEGKIYMQPEDVDLSTNLEGNFIAGAYDPALGGNDAYILDNEGKFYTLSGTTLTKRQTDATYSYVFGTSDMAVFGGNLFATSSTNIALLAGLGNLASIDEDWWTATRAHGSLSSTNRHPLVVVEDTLYIADGNLIHSWDGTTSVPSALTLPSIWGITCMIKHPNGRDLIAFCSSTADYSHTRGARSVAFIINTVTLEFTQEIPIDAQVEGARLVGGVLYVMYGRNLGYFTDTGIAFLRRLEEIDLQGFRLGYKYHMGDLEGHLLVVEQDHVLAFGDLGAGKVFWYPITNRPHTGRPLDAILPIGNGQIIYGTETSGGVEKLYKLDFYSTGSTSTTNFYTNKISFPRRVWIRRIDVVHDQFTTGTGIALYNILNTGAADQIAIRSYTLDGATNVSRYDANIYTDVLQLLLQWSGSPKGFNKITIYYEPAEA